MIFSEEVFGLPLFFVIKGGTFMKHNFAYTLGKAAARHAPEVLTGFGIAGMFTAVIFAVRATPKAVKIIEERETEKGEELTKAETVQTAWRCYIPTAAACLGAVICFISANAVHAKRSAALTAAYALSESALLEYRQKVIDTVGEKKEEIIHTAVVQDKIDKTHPAKSEVIITGNGDTLCFDAFAGRYFHSDKAKIDRAVNELNRMILSDDFASLNDFYDLIGLKHTELGDSLGWNSKHRGYVDARFSSHLTEDSRPCLAISFNVAPKYEYDRY